MKVKLYILFSIVLKSSIGFSQVGIGTTTPQAALEVSSTTSGILIPRMTEAQRDLISVPLDGMLVYVTDGANPGFFYYEINTMAWVNTIGADDQDSSEVAYDNTSSGLTSINTQDAIDELNSGKGQVVQVTEGANTGYRYRGQDATNHTNIGTHATDLASATGTHTNVGASGNYSLALGKDAYAEGHGSVAMGEESDAIGRYSVALGRRNESSGFNSAVVGGETNVVNAAAKFGAIVGGNENTVAGQRAATVGGYRLEAPSQSEVAFGEYNTTYTTSVGGDLAFNTSDRVLSVGIGTGTGTRADALEVFKDGKIFADQLEVSEITDNKQLVTKEYVDTSLASGSGGVLEEITENFQTGYRIKGSTNDANYGDIGNNSVDLSYSSSASSTLGATGSRSFAVGEDARASGIISTAIGKMAQATSTGAIAIGYNANSGGLYATAIGYDTQAPGYNSSSIGRSTIANSNYEVAVGGYNTSYSPVSTSSFQPADKAFVVGIGTGTSSRADGFEVFKSGKIYADELDVSEITDDKQLVTKEYVDTSLASGTGGVLEEITEGGNTGYRINGSTVPSSYYGDIGERAVDLSNSTNSGTYGATGDASFAAGQASYSQSYCSIAMGYNCNSNSSYATAMGYQTHAFGSSSFGAGYQANTDGMASISLGYQTLASSWAEVALGAHNTIITPLNKTDFDPNDRVLAVGIGSNWSSRADGLEVFKNGKIYADELDISEITDNKQLVTKEYVDNFSEVRIVDRATITPVLGTLIVDSSDSNQLKFYDGTNWNYVNLTVIP